MVLEQFIIDADIIWDQVGKTFFENPEAKAGRIMRVQVVNAGIVEDLTGYTLNLGWTSVRDPSKFGLDAFDDVDITKGIFEIEYTSGMLTNVGPLNASLQLVPPGEGRPVESNNFKLTVKNSAINPAAIQGETSFSTLENALVEVNGWNARIDVVEQEFKDRADALDGAYPVRLTDVEQQSSLAATKADTASLKADAMSSGSPKGVYTTLSALQVAFPIGASGAYLVTADGNWYYWSGTSWEIGGLYQSSGVADKSLSPIKLNENFDFMPIVSYFGRRTVNTTTGEFTTSSTRYTSDYITCDDAHIIVCTDTSYKIAVRLVDSMKATIYTSPFFIGSINLNAYLTANPQATQYLVYVASVSDDTTISLGLGDYLSTVIYVKTDNHPVTKAELYAESIELSSEITSGVKNNALKEWYQKFPTANFDKLLLTVDANGYLTLANAISDITFHKWLAYAKTDKSRQIYSYKTRFLASSGASNRMFIESSDGKIVWIGLSKSTVPAKIDCYSLNKYDGTYSEIPYSLTESAEYTYPVDGVMIDLEIRLVGKGMFVYVDGVLRKVFELDNHIGDRVNKCGISYRGNISSNSTLVDFEVQYKSEKIMHFSFDDTFDLLKELTVNEANYTSIFSHPTFLLLQNLHNTYGAVFTFFLFYARTDDTFNMAQVTTKYKAEFEANSDWLKFGYHSLYQDTYSKNLTDVELIQNVKDMHVAISNFAGLNAIDKIVRFGYFSVNQSALITLKEQNLILGTLTADDTRTSNNGLVGSPLTIVQTYDRYSDLANGIHYFRTEQRFDTLGSTAAMTNYLNTLFNDRKNNEIYIIFGHSVAQTPLTAACEWGYKKGNIRFDFPQNII